MTKWGPSAMSYGGFRAFIDKAINIYWSHRWMRFTLAILQIVVITVLRYGLMCICFVSFLKVK